MLRRTAVCMGLSLGLLAAIPAGAKERPRPPMPPGYNDAGPAPADVLAKVVHRLRTTLKDPYSIRDFRMCALHKAGPYYALEWMPAYWTVEITLNSKNSYGGYVGSTLYSVDFKNGEVDSLTEFKGLDFVPSSVNEKILAEAQSCPRVGDEQIQKLLVN